MADAMKRLPEPSFWTLEDFAQDAGITVDRVMVYARDGLLTITTEQVDGVDRRGITADEWRRFLGIAKRAEPSTRELESLYRFVAEMAVAYAGGEAELRDRPHSLIRNLEAVTAAQGLQLSRTDDTYAKFLRKGFALLQADGYRYGPRGDDERMERAA